MKENRVSSGGLCMVGHTVSSINLNIIRRSIFNNDRNISNCLYN